MYAHTDVLNNLFSKGLKFLELSQCHIINSIRLPSVLPDYYSLSALRIVDGGLIVVDLHALNFGWMSQIISLFAKEYVLPVIFLDLSIGEYATKDGLNRKLLHEHVTDFLREIAKIVAIAEEMSYKDKRIRKFSIDHVIFGSAYYYWAFTFRQLI